MPKRVLKYPIVTRYAAAKLIGSQESVFSRMWKRQLVADDFYGFFDENGDVDIEHPTFQEKYFDRIKPDVLEKLKNKGKKKKPVKKQEQSKQEPRKKRGRPPGTKNKTKQTKSGYQPTQPRTPQTPPPKNPSAPPPEDPEDPEKLEMKELANRSMIAKYKKEIFAAEKAEMELRKARAELAELQTIGETCIGYLIALNQDLLDQPRSFVDEMISGIKTGKSKTDLTDILRKPAMAAISEAQEFIKKELARYKRDIKSENKNE